MNTDVSTERFHGVEDKGFDTFDDLNAGVFFADDVLWSLQKRIRLSNRPEWAEYYNAIKASRQKLLNLFQLIAVDPD